MDATSGQTKIRIVKTSTLHGHELHDLLPIPHTTRPSDSQALRRCVGDVESFTTQIWGKRTHVSHDSALRAELITLTDIDRLLTATSVLRWDHIRLVQDGTIIPRPSHLRPMREAMPQASRGAAESDRLLDAVHRGIASPSEVIVAVTAGATLILQAVHWYHRPVMDFCRALELFIGHKCQANFYLGPPSAQAFTRHTDEHDLFILQVFGEKVWHLEQTPWEEEHGVAATHGEIVLRPGDVLYMPKGTPHLVRTESEMSGHLSIGALPNTWRDIMLGVLMESLEGHSLDEELPLDWMREASRLAEIGDKRMAELSDRLASLSLETAHSAHLRRFLDQLPDRIPGSFETRVSCEEINDDTILVRASGVPCELFARSAARTLYAVLGQRTVSMPLEFSPAMRRILDLETFRPADLADTLCQQDRIELCRTLRNAHLLLPEATDGIDERPVAC
ncbi:cupin domain-containing protein [Nonomuraea sp. NPDC050643]|uniref:JmjC domain-containing protein n=1 Tax=Nonomuraea sp. NPDC050643 TaxID=3155660 RepID=UPI0034024D5F